MDTIFNGLNDKILEMFTGWLENAVDIFLQFIENISFLGLTFNS